MGKNPSARVSSRYYNKNSCQPSYVRNTFSWNALQGCTNTNVGQQRRSVLQEQLCLDRSPHRKLLVPQLTDRENQRACKLRLRYKLVSSEVSHAIAARTLIPLRIAPSHCHYHRIFVVVVCSSERLAIVTAAPVVKSRLTCIDTVTQGWLQPSYCFSLCSIWVWYLLICRNSLA